MQIVRNTQHALLAFVDACNRNHYEPTVGEVEAWLKLPQPHDPAYDLVRRAKSWLSAGGLDRPSTPNSADQWLFVQRLSNQFSDSFEASMAQPAGSEGSRLRSDENVVVEVEPAESALKHLVRIGWLEYLSDGAGSDDDRVQITQLGRALLRDAETGEADDDQVSVVVLRRDDVLAYPKLVGLLAGLGDGLLVDPYLRVEHLHDLVTITQLTRLLIGQPKPQDRGRHDDLASMKVYLASPQLPRKIEVRVAEAVHDRVVIASRGDAFTLGTSLNGVGRTTTVFTPLPAAAASALRDEYEAMWRDATPISPAEPEQNSNGGEPVSPDANEQAHEIRADPEAADDDSADGDDKEGGKS